MEMWYTEEQTNNVRFSIRCDKQKYSAQSDFQRIEIFSTPEFGDILVLDDRIMLTQKDEFIYHEMISHVPMAVNPDIKNVLVIGAGDGGVTVVLSVSLQNTSLSKKSTWWKLTEWSLMPARNFSPLSLQNSVTPVSIYSLMTAYVLSVMLKTNTI